MMERNDLKQALESIGWKLRFCGCDEYVAINNIGKESDIEVSVDRIKITTRKVFGDIKSRKYPDYMTFGCICFYYKDCNLVVEADHVSLVGKDNGGCFITFRKIEAIS